MKTLVIPDIHCAHKRAQKILDKYEPAADITIFLGDYFDQFNDTVLDNEETAKWLAKAIKKPNRKFLLGNHDIHYIAETYEWRCAGYTPGKHAAISAILKHRHWRHLTLCAWIDGVLYTHAGVHESFIRKDKSHPGMYLSLCRGALKSFRTKLKKPEKRTSPLLEAGRSRGGHLEHGGVLWADFNQDMKLSSLYINQVVGHTPMARDVYVEDMYNGGKLMGIDSYPPLKFPMMVTDGVLPGEILK